MRERYVGAFGVDPELRRRRIGTKLQAFAVEHCRGDRLDEHAEEFSVGVIADETVVECGH